MARAHGSSNRIAPARQPLYLFLGLVALLCLGGTGIGGFFLFQGTREPAVPARVAAEAFLARWKEGDAQGAYGQMCTATQERMSPGTFAASVDARPALAAYTIDEVVEQPDESVAIKVTLTDVDGLATAHTFRVIADKGAWRICGDVLPAES